MTAAAIGFILLGQGSATRPGRAVTAVAAATLAVYGVVLLATSVPVATEPIDHETIGRHTGP